MPNANDKDIKLAGSMNPRRYEFGCYATAAIAKNEIVYISGTRGKRFEVTKADADAQETTEGMLLLAKHAVKSGAMGRFTAIGAIEDVNTSAGVQGQPIYLSSTAGGWSATPVGLGRKIGRVIEVSETAGVILFNGLSQTRDNLVNPAASTAVTGATETLTAFSTATYTLAANRLRVGTRVRVRAVGRVTAATGAEVHVLAVMLGGVAIMVTGDIDPAANDVFIVDAEFVVRAVGATGTIVGAGIVSSGPQAVAAPASHLIATGVTTTSTTTIDTTGALAVAVGVDRQATATDADSMRVDSFRVDIDG